MSWKTDFRYAVRSLRFSPGVTLVAVLTLAVGIAVTTAMFTVVDGVLLKPLRYPDADRIVALSTHWTDSGKTSPRTTGGDLEDERTDTASFEAFSYYSGAEVGVSLKNSAMFVGTYQVDPEFFRVFRVVPLAGRTFAADDAGRAAVVAVRFAEQNFGSAKAAIGEVIRTNGVFYQIVGVMPAMFQFPKQAEVWVAASPVPPNRARTAFNYYTVGKLKAGVSTTMADAHLAGIAARLASSYPDTNKNKTFVVRGLQDELAAPVRGSLLLLMGAVALVLLIACANVANLLLARAAGRTREIAVKCALGASRAAVVRQLLTESVVLALVAGAVGVVLAGFAVQAMLDISGRFLPATLLGDVRLDWRILLFAALASLGTSIIFGLAPAWQATKIDLQEALKQAAGRGSVGRERSRLRSGLVVAQIALSVTLAVGAGLLFRTLLALNSSDMGFRTQGILVTNAHAPARDSSSSNAESRFWGITLNDALRAGRFFDELLGRLRGLPNVSAAAGAMGLPAGEIGSNGYFAIEGKQTFGGDLRKLPYADFALASPGYFSTMGIALRAGRDFNEGDDYDHPFVVLISQSVATQNFPHEDPIGHRIQCGLDAPDKWMTIVGVVGDVRQDSPASTPGPELYMPLRQHPFQAREVQIVVRTNGDPAALIPAVQNTIRQMDPEVAMKSQTMTEVIGESVAAPRFRTVLAITFAGVALLLALAGMYAVMSYLTVQRTPEFAVRMALGARPTDVLRLVLERAARLGAIGVCLGVALSVLSDRLLATMLFGLKSTDPTTYVVVIALVLPVVIAAAAMPAWRASRVEPAVALRNE
jgi:putative ABC transport system permease protein